VRSFLLGLWQRLRGTPGSAVRAAAAVAVGLFIGCQPLYGLHFVLVLAVCVPFKLDSLLSYLAANISNPLFAPFLIFSEVEVGAYLTTGHFVAFDVAQARATGALGFARQLLVGGVVVGALLAVCGFGLGWLIASRRGLGRPAVSSRENELAAATERTRARYENAPPAHRFYVAGKLAFDPVFKLLSELPELGHVLDLGCGRGQLSLLLLELGRATRVTGLDSDADKIQVARAAGPEADFRVADVAHAELPRADTVLLIDVLHYLPLAEQDALLLGAARALEPGGRLLIRELDGDPSARGAVTRFFEWWARRIGLNRGRATAYRPARAVTQLLERAGLPCRIQGASERTPFANVLIVAGGSPNVNVERASSAPSTSISAAKA
jgi:SAM-dependent methyltransferase